MKRFGVLAVLLFSTGGLRSAVTSETLVSVTVSTSNAMQTAVALDSRNTVHLAFFDPATQALKYAKLTNGTTTWAVSTITGSGTVGPQCGLALSGSTPHVVYYETTSGSEGVKHARLSSGGSWNVDTVESFVGTNTYVSIALGTDGLPRVAYYNSAASATAYGFYTGTAWSTYTVVTSTFAGPVDLALTSGDQPRLAFISGSTTTSHRTLAFAVPSVSSFTVTSTYDIGSDTIPVGGVSMALDSSARAHVAVYDGSQDALGYARFSAAGAAETSAVVDATAGAGFYNDMAVTSANAPVIVYSSEGVGLRQATLSGSWSAATIESSTDAFAGPSLVLNNYNHAVVGCFRGGTNTLKLVTEAPRDLSIRGSVTDFSSVPLPTATLSLSGMIASASVPISSTGGYTVSSLWEGAYTLVPSLAGYAFEPSGRSYSPLTGNQTGQNFLGGPSAFSVIGNVFNPLNGEQAQVNFSVVPGHVRVRLFTLQGRPVITLVDETKSAGSYSVPWDGRTDSGDVVGSGVYLVLFETDRLRETKKIVVVK